MLLCCCCCLQIWKKCFVKNVWLAKNIKSSFPKNCLFFPICSDALETLTCTTFEGGVLNEKCIWIGFENFIINFASIFFSDKFWTEDECLNKSDNGDLVTAKLVGKNLSVIVSNVYAPNDHIEEYFPGTPVFTQYTSARRRYAPHDLAMKSYNKI